MAIQLTAAEEVALMIERLLRIQTRHAHVEAINVPLGIACDMLRKAKRRLYEANQPPTQP